MKIDIHIETEDTDVLTLCQRILESSIEKHGKISKDQAESALRAIRKAKEQR
jgi:hypothetical protein